MPLGRSRRRVTKFSWSGSTKPDSPPPPPSRKVAFPPPGADATRSVTVWGGRPKFLTVSVSVIGSPNWADCDGKGVEIRRPWNPAAAGSGVAAAINTHINNARRTRTIRDLLLDDLDR